MSRPVSHRDSHYLRKSSNTSASVVPAHIFNLLHVCKVNSFFHTTFNHITLARPRHRTFVWNYKKTCEHRVQTRSLADNAQNWLEFWGILWSAENWKYCAAGDLFIWFSHGLTWLARTTSDLLKKQSWLLLLMTIDGTRFAINSWSLYVTGPAFASSAPAMPASRRRWLARILPSCSCFADASNLWCWFFTSPPFWSENR
jgi:hypothetical protein